MTLNDTTIDDPDLAKVETALKRAALKARKIAKDTSTPLVIYKNGKIVMQYPEKDDHKD